MKKLILTSIILIVVLTSCQKIQMYILGNNPEQVPNGKWLLTRVYREQEPIAWYDYSYDENYNLTNFYSIREYVPNEPPDTTYSVEFTCEDGKVIHSVSSWGVSASFIYDDEKRLVQNTIQYNPNNEVVYAYTFSATNDTVFYTKNNTDEKYYVLDEHQNIISNNGVEQTFVDLKNPDPLIKFTSPFYHGFYEVWGDEGYDFMIIGEEYNNSNYTLNSNGLITRYDHNNVGGLWCTYNITYTLYNGTPN